MTRQMAGPPASVDTTGCERQSLHWNVCHVDTLQQQQDSKKAVLWISWLELPNLWDTQQNGSKIERLPLHALQHRTLPTSRNPGFTHRLSHLQLAAPEQGPERGVDAEAIHCSSKHSVLQYT
jgi:hypothetical protein